MPVTPGEALDRLAAATSDEEALAIEAELVRQTDNRPHEGDPTQPEEG